MQDRWIEIPKEYRYLKKTRDGYEITDVLQSTSGILAVVVKQDRGKYGISWGNIKQYDPIRGDGYWGRYGYDTREDALEDLYGRFDAPLTRFDPHSYLDVHHEYDGQYNWNHVDKEYLSHHDHRDPGFDTFNHRTDFMEHPFDNRTEWEAWKRDVYRKENSPRRQESYNIRMEPKYVDRRNDATFWSENEYLDSFGRYICINGNAVIPTWENLVATLERYLNGDTKRAAALARMIGEDGQEFVWEHEDVARLVGLRDVDFWLSAQYPPDEDREERSYSVKRGTVAKKPAKKPVKKTVSKAKKPTVKKKQPTKAKAKGRR